MIDTEQEKELTRKAAYYAANRERVLAQQNAYRAANAERIKARQAAHRAGNCEKIKARQAARYAANPAQFRARIDAYNAANTEKVKAFKSAYRAANRDKANGRQTARYKTDLNFRITLLIRSHLRRIVKSGGAKDATSLSYVGCTVAQLRRHLERQFTPGMTWQNHGEWHIDHIIPLAAFDFAAFPAQIKQAQHYTNLRPMWARDNLAKSDTLPHPVQLDLIAV